MTKRRDIRRLAMQVLYQIDMSSETDRDAIYASVDDDFDSEAVRQAAVELALQAWGTKADADALVADLAPDWPTHRQPPVDRAILRLSYHEMVTGRTPVKVAINEAVELAKRFGSEDSPAFINGVLDKIAKKLNEEGKIPDPQTAPPAEDAWLADAVQSDADDVFDEADD